jgi:hypothetical protein
MALERLRQLARERLPQGVFGPLRVAGTTILAPILFSLKSGHARSALGQRAVDAAGKPTLWVTYPTIDLIRCKDLRGRSVLEFGAGQSTLFWAHRAHKVVSMEDNVTWYEDVRGRLPPNADVHLVPTDLTGVRELLGRHDRFDIILVDGLDRAAACTLARSFVADAGVVILDNADVQWGSEGTAAIMQAFRREGFQRVDFYGIAPGVLDPHCTSLFFRERCFLFAGEEAPARLV